MYSHILVALDGSLRAEHVLPHVETLATKLGSVVILGRAMAADRSLLHPAASTVPVALSTPRISTNMLSTSDRF